MSRLKDNVPELELCKKIPEGYFEDSALVWAMDEDGMEFVIERDVAAPILDVIANAPTLEEILFELAQMEICPTIGALLTVKGDAIYTIDADWEQVQGVNSAATAALKMWFIQKGAE